MSFMTTITSGAAGTWAAVSALVKAGLANGTVQAIAAAIVANMPCFKSNGAKKNCALAVADIVEFEPGSDNIETLTNAIARLSYVLEQELKAKKEREDAKKQ